MTVIPSFKSGISRRGFLRGTIAAGAAASIAPALTACGTAGKAATLADGPAAPLSRAYPFTVGGLSGVVLSDGTVRLGPVVPGVVTNADEAAATALLEENFLPTTHVQAPLNTVLVRSGGRNVLIDAGYGAAGPDTAGLQSAALGSAGLDEDAIDTVVITHAHPDHLNGYLAAEGGSRFAGAEFVISEQEYNFWSNPANEIAAMAGLFETARQAFALAGNRLRTVRFGGTIAPGITAVDAAGHTPVHMAVRLDDGDESLLLTADTANHPILFLRHPEWHFSFDFDPDKASATRRRILETAANERQRILAYHFPFPGIGRIRSSGASSFEFVAEPWGGIS